MQHEGRSLTRRERLTFAVASLLAAAAAAGGVLIAANHPGHHRHQHSVVFIAVFAVVLAVVVGVASWWAVRRNAARPSMQRLRGFAYADRRATAKAVQKGRPLTERERTIAEAVVDHFSSMSQRRARWVMPLAGVLFGINAIANTSGLRWLWAGLVILEASCAAAWILLLHRLMDRYRRALKASEPT